MLSIETGVAIQILHKLENTAVYQGEDDRKGINVTDVTIMTVLIEESLQDIEQNKHLNIEDETDYSLVVIFNEVLFVPVVIVTF